MNNDLWLERAAYIESMEREVDALRQQLANMVERYNVRKELADHLGQELAEKDAEIERLRDGQIDKLLAMTDEQVTALCRLEGSNPEDSARIAKQAMQLAAVNVELAASQAREQQLREAHTAVVSAIDAAYVEGLSERLAEFPIDVGGVRDLVERRLLWAGSYAEEALALPADTSTLEALIAKAGEVMRRRMLEPVARAIYTQWSILPEYVTWVDGGNSVNQDQARNLSLKAVRALPGVKLEDLK